MSAARQAITLMFLGAPGAGKGTYASRIAPMLQIPTISTGDLVRSEIKAGSALGKTIKMHSEQGSLVPDQLMLEMVAKRLSNDEAKRGYILDGFPRTVPQAEAFQNISPLNLVVNIELPQWILVDKLKGRRVCNSCGTGYNVAFINQGEYYMPPLLPQKEGECDKCGSSDIIQRADDAEEVVKKRLQVYNDETAPLIDFYDKEGSLRTFHVKKGLGDLNALVELIQTELKIEHLETYAA